jgi:hypothetical protein
MVTEVTGRRETFSLLFAGFSVWMLLAGCGQTAAPKPDLPQSVSPGWKLSSLARSATPSGLSGDGAPQCWKAEYTGQGSAQVWTCWYKERANAFEAAQRTRAEAQAVKFQEGSYLVVVRWNNVSKANITALVRAVEKATAPR